MGAPGHDVLAGRSWPGFLLPVGHRLGQLHDPAAPGPRQVVVRHGGTAELLSPADTRAWERLRAPAGRATECRAVEVAWRLQQVGIDPGPAVDDLVARGLLVHVDPLAEDAAVVSATVRARALGSAVGGTPDGGMAYGLPGATPLARLAAPHVEVWVCAVLAPHLGRAVEALQVLWADEPALAGPGAADRLRVDVWDVVTRMVAAGAGYLDQTG